MADPRFARCIDFMSRDPKGCKEFYMKNDPKFFADFMQFFGENMKRISTQMEKLSTSDEPVKKPEISKCKNKDELKMDEILSRPAVKDAVSNPEVAKLIHLLRSDPNAGQRHLQNLNSKTKKDVQILVENGILNFQ